MATTRSALLAAAAWLYVRCCRLTIAGPVERDAPAIVGYHRDRER